LKQKETADTLSAVHSAIELNPHVGEFPRMLALCQEAAGEFKQAIRQKQKATTLDDRTEFDLYKLRERVK
jgi:hypothetical protein